MFVHLHVHTEYSLLDGACRIGPLLDRAKDLGQTALAITDHGNLFGVIEFYKAARERGIHPILGCECYVAARSLSQKEAPMDLSRAHLVLLCENETGYRNLLALVSRSYVDGFYVKPRIDHALLEQHHEGLIALSACLAGELPKALLSGDNEEAKRLARWYETTFGPGNFFLEVQNHKLPEQRQVLPLLVRLSRETGIPLVATNDVHYLQQTDHKVQQALICVQTNQIMEKNTALGTPQPGGVSGNSEPLRMFPTPEFYLKSEQEMRALFPMCPEAIDQSAHIAARCSVEIEFGKLQLPQFLLPKSAQPDAQTDTSVAPKERDHYDYFYEMCVAGLHQRYGEPPKKEIQERLDYECSVIQSMGFVDYFLIVQDFVAYAKSQGIAVGPGRGSGAGSLAAYCIGITGIDPVRYDLLFERFLNPERVSMPDFDIDFCYVRRQEVIDYVVQKYGADHVAQIITFNTMAARAAVRDIGRALGHPYQTVDKLAKLIPMELKISIQKALEQSPELKKIYDSQTEIRELMDMAKQVEGMPRNASTHAAGVVITQEPVSFSVPLARNEDAIVTQFPMTTLEELGLLKMDFLGLRTLTVLHDAEKFIQKSSFQQETQDFFLKKNAPKHEKKHEKQAISLEKRPQSDPQKNFFSLETIPLDDPETYHMLAQGNTDGVFQFESAGMRRVLMRLKPEHLEDLIAVISLYRPGPMDSIPRYIENRHHPEKTTYLCPELEPILRVTYGCLVYQEQVMQVFRALAGYSYGRADIVRRAMSKKKHHVLEQEREHFLAGCTKHHIKPAVATQIFDEMSRFASYAFNKSHAAAYAFLAWQTAYLKCHHPKEFLAALLSSFLDNSGRVAEYAAECTRLGIPLLPPHVNSAEEAFCVEPEGIRFGLLAIKNLGHGMILQILQERNKELFTSFYDFLRRLQGKDLNRRAVESLIKAGALDGLGGNRRELWMMLPIFLEKLGHESRQNVAGQISFLDLFSAPESQAPESQEPESQAPAPHNNAIRPPQIEPQQDFDRGTLLQYEKETLGLYLSGHPLSQFQSLAQERSAARILDLYDPELFPDNCTVTILCVVLSVKKKVVKHNQTMAFLTVEDLSAQIELLLFPSAYETYVSLCVEGRLLQISGRLSLQEEQPPKLLVQELHTLEDPLVPLTDQNDTQPSPPKDEHVLPPITLRFVNKLDPRLPKARNFLVLFEEDGTQPLSFCFTETQETVAQPPVAWNPVLERALARLLDP